MPTPADPIIESILIDEEGFRAFLYDDQNGAPLTKGSTIYGNPTVGYGIALNKSPLTKDEALFLLRNRYSAVETNLATEYEWFSTLSAPRQAVLVCLGYQCGLGGLGGFTAMLHACAVGDWPTAATEMLDSHWATQTPARAQRMAGIMRSGTV
jgi:lysozyme